MNKNEKPQRIYGALTENQELRQLVAARCHGTATPEQWTRLCALIKENSEFLEYYVSHMSLHCGMSQILFKLPPTEMTEDAGVTLAGAEMEDDAAVKVQRSPFSMTGSLSWKSLSPAWGAVVVLLFVVAAGAWFWPRPVDEASSPIVQAWVIQNEDGAVHQKLVNGDSVSQSEGTSQMIFRNGVQLTLTGLADLEVLSDSEVRLNSGQLQADVGPNGKGFRVLTSTADVLDLGTIFGVQVVPTGETDVVVFDGEVKLRPTEIGTTPYSAANPSLYQGEAVRVENNGQQSRIPTIWQNADSSTWSTVKSPEIDSPIESVHDNLSSDGAQKYYAVVHQGFDEDAKVYVDRNYEWNSLKGSEIPYELIGADYIRTFNDDKYQDQLEIELTINRPVILYLLWDPRHIPTKWLLEEFEPMGLRLGMDLGEDLGPAGEPAPPPGIAAERFLGRGEGDSVDIPFSVWRRIVPEAGVVHLGANGSRSRALKESELSKPGSMYGIVVRPLSANSLNPSVSQKNQ